MVRLTPACLFETVHIHVQCSVLSRLSRFVPTPCVIHMARMAMDMFMHQCLPCDSGSAKG